MPLQATLEEVVEADILIHVMDGGSVQMLQQRQAVLSILQQLGKSQLLSSVTFAHVWCVLAKLGSACSSGSRMQGQQKWVMRGSVENVSGAHLLHLYQPAHRRSTRHA